MEFFQQMNQETVIRVVLLASLALVLIGLSQKVIPWIADRLSGRHRLYVLATVPLTRLVIILASVWMIISIVVDPKAQNIFALLGTLALALGFAFKDYVGSLIAGIVTLYELPYRLGDWISVDGAYGEVKSIGMRSYEILTPDDTVVVVPHLKLWGEMIFNANDGSRHLQCVARFYLHPEHDPGLVIQALEDTAMTSAYLQLLKPVVILASEGPWATEYRIKAYPVDARDQFRFTTDLTLRGKQALMDLGVRFPAPGVLDSREGA
ncbi:mechanosensitive ion channel domain-containing protein [Desulfobacter postgatei]|uniref:mechanosensitive ion channel domain-containing protein n=1 Tax=Desulfobacter postgatei TaxID=2293 RepID=UPI00259AF55C|nr:mechanosensitive ion channel domain-containing protein [uncultured Desulfobacter sp.]